MPYKRLRLSRGSILPAFAVASCALLLATTSSAQTAPNPGSKTRLNVRPSAMVHLTGLGAADQTVQLAKKLPNGTNVPGPLTMPAGAVLILTDVDCSAVGTTATGRLSARLVIPSTGEEALRCVFDTTFDGPAKQVAYTTGQVLSKIPDVEFGAANTGSVGVHLRGYYVKDK